MQKKQFEIGNEAFVISKLDEGETVKAFDCGDDDLNDFIVNECVHYRKEKLAVTYVLEPEEDVAHEHIAAFFSLANDRISLVDFDNKTQYNRFSKRFNNHKRLKSYPAVKIGRLGVSLAMKGQALGSFLLRFIKMYFLLDNKTGCRFITVDACSADVPFYLKNGFVPLNDDDIDDPTRLRYFDLNDMSDKLLTPKPLNLEMQNIQRS